MDTDFWLSRWVEGQIGFHQDQINGYLIRQWAKTGPVPATDPVLVPLCGKSKDMLWLEEQGHRVLGVELSQLAIDEFFKENSLTPSQHETTHFTVTESKLISLWCGDFFALDKSDMRDITRVYDRASLIALPPEMRQQYAKHLSTLLDPGNHVLLVTMEYSQSEMNGPPFSVTEDEVNQLYEDDFDIQPLEAVDILKENPQFMERGLTGLTEKCYLMVRR